MDLTFHRRRPGAVYYIPKAAKLPKVAKLIDLPGIGPKSVAALSADNIRSVSELVLKFEDAGSEWLKNVLPYGVSVKRISTSIVACRV